MNSDFDKHMGLLKRLSLDFCRRYPSLDKDEIQAETVLIAVDAIRTHKPERGAMTTWLALRVQRGLINKLKGQCWRRFARKHCQDLEDNRPARTRFSLRQLMNEVSKDATVAISLVVFNRLSRGVLKRTLKDLGWSKRRINNVFEEVRNAL